MQNEMFRVPKDQLIMPASILAFCVGSFLLIVMYHCIEHDSNKEPVKVETSNE